MSSTETKDDVEDPNNSNQELLRNLVLVTTSHKGKETVRRGLVVEVNGSKANVKMGKKIERWVPVASMRRLVEGMQPRPVTKKGRQNDNKNNDNGSAKTVDLYCIVTSTLTGEAVLYGSLHSLGGYSKGIRLNELELKRHNNKTNSLEYRVFHSKLNLNNNNWNDNRRHQQNFVGLFSVVLQIGDVIVARVCFQRIHSALFLIDETITEIETGQTVAALVNAVLSHKSKTPPCLPIIRALWYQYKDTCYNNDGENCSTCSIILDQLLARLQCSEEENDSLFHVALCALWIVGILNDESDDDIYTSMFEKYESDWGKILQLMEDAAITGGIRNDIEKLAQNTVFISWQYLVVNVCKRTGTPLKFITTANTIQRICTKAKCNFNYAAEQMLLAIGGKRNYNDVLNKVLASVLQKRQTDNGQLCLPNNDSARLQFQLLTKLCRRGFEDSFSVLRVYLEHSRTLCDMVSGHLQDSIVNLCTNCTVEQLRELVEVLFSENVNCSGLMQIEDIILTILKQNYNFSSWHDVTSEEFIKLLSCVHQGNSSPIHSNPHQQERKFRIRFRDALKPKLEPIIIHAKASIVSTEKKSFIASGLDSINKWIGVKEVDDDKAIQESAKLIGWELLRPLISLVNATQFAGIQNEEFAHDIVTHIRNEALPHDMSHFLVAEYFAYLLSCLDDGDELSSIYRRVLTGRVVDEVLHEARKTTCSDDRSRIISILCDRLKGWDSDVVGNLIVSVFSMEYTVTEKITPSDVITNARIFLAVVEASKSIRTPRLEVTCNKIFTAAVIFSSTLIDNDALIRDVIHASTEKEGLRRLWDSVLMTPNLVHETLSSIEQQRGRIQSLDVLKEAYKSSVSPILSQFDAADSAFSMLNQSSTSTIREYERMITDCCFGCETDLLRAHELINSSLFEIILDKQVEEQADLFTGSNITAEVICTEIIPTALDELRRCTMMLHGNTLMRQHAQLWFGSIHKHKASALRYELEIASRFACRYWEINFSPEKQYHIIDDFFFMDQCIDWLNILIQVRVAFPGVLFLSKNCNEDLMHSELTSFLNEHDTVRDDQLLSSVTPLASKYRGYLKHLTPQHMDFLKKLLSDIERSKNLLVWLREFHDDGQFQAKADLFRECVDDSLLLQALSCLVSVRATVLQPLMSRAAANGNLFTCLQDFVDAVGQIDVPASRVAELVCILESFMSICEAMATHSLTPGVQALWKLVRLHQRGVYSICTASGMDEDSVQALILHEPANTTPLNPSDLSPDNIEEKLGMQQLLKLHALVLMTEIQPELSQRIEDETGVDLRATVNSFRRGEVAVLASINELLQELTRQGHPLCIQRNANYHFVECKEDTFSFLDKTKREFLQMRADFMRVIRESRRQFPFLNFFTINQLHQIADVVIAVSRGQDEPASLARYLIYASRRDVDTSQLPDDMLLQQARRLEELRECLETNQGVTEYLECIELLLQHCSTLDLSCSTQMPFSRDLLRRCSIVVWQEDNKLDLPDDEFWVALHDSRLRKQRPVAIATFANDHDALQALWGVYARLGGIPEPSEVLLCESDVSVEQVDIFLHRWESCDCLDWMFSMVGVERLSVEAQNQLCHRVLSYQPQKRESAFLLLLHGGSENSKNTKHALLNALAPIKVDVQVPATNNAAIALRHSIDSFYGRDTVIFVRSGSSGSGKTRFVLQRASELHPPGVIIPMMISEHSTREELGNRLIQANSLLGDSKATRVFHIDIAHRTLDTVTNILVELLVLGKLSWSSQQGRLSGSFDRQPRDIFALELQLAQRRPAALEALVGSLFATQYVEDKPAIGFCMREFHREQEEGQSHLSVSRRRVERHRAIAAIFFDLVESKAINTAMILGDDLYEPVGAACKFPLFRDKLPHLVPGASMRSVDSLTRIVSLWATAMDCWPLCYPGVLDEGNHCTPWRAVFGSLVRSTALSFTRRRVPQIAVDRNGDSERLLEQQLDQLGQLESFDREPLLVLKCQGACGVEAEMHINGIEIMSFDSTRLQQAIQDPTLIQILQHNGLNLKRDWSDLSHNEAIKLLQEADGQQLHDLHENSTQQASSGYVFSVDNFLKMLILHTRLSVGIPVILMGETGCGKSSLLSEMCRILSWPLGTFRVHGGVDQKQVEEWMQEQIELAYKQPNVRRLVFLDEINTADCMSVFKNILCDRLLQALGLMLPLNLHVVAACNPYRIKSESHRRREERDGLLSEAYLHESSSVQYRQGSGPFRDNLRHLVYRVHSLPDALLDFIFDFGALSSATEAVYIKTIVSQRIPEHREFSCSISEMLHHCQEVTRDVHEGERSVVSLRDVSRFLSIFEWSLEHWHHFEGSWANSGKETIYSKIDSDKDMCELVTSCVCIAAMFCYCNRLTTSQRGEFLNRMQQIIGRSSLHKSVKQVWESQKSWEFLMDRVQSHVVDAMKLGPGIARNSALKENLMMLFVAIMSRTPIIVVGKPGSSKSLAMSLIRQSMRGAESRGPLSKFPAATVFSYQCSPLSTSAGIEKIFCLADQTETGDHKGNIDTRTIQVILLDEIGLAEQSPHLPLKVLHKLLDERCGRVAVVGLSNWALDPAKMNRAVHLFRPAPSENDLTQTAKALTSDPALRRHLSNLASAYYRIYQNQEQDDFFGLRDFYSLVRTLAASLRNAAAIDDNGDDREGRQSCGITPELLAKAVLRNFGGRPENERDTILKIFFDDVGVRLPTSLPSIMNLISSNFESVKHSARHLLLLTKNDAALDLLFECKLLDPQNSEVIIGSDFVGDRSEMLQYDALEKIRCCMSAGHRVVLIHCEYLYESLYDVLNQHYTSFADQTYTRLAFGPESQTCYIDDNFRICVIVEAEEAYSRISPALLNRFEKQVLDRSTLLSPDCRELMQQLENHVLRDLCLDGAIEPNQVVVGYHRGVLASLVQLADTSKSSLLRRLLSCCSPEALCLLAQSTNSRHRDNIKFETGVDPVDCYFDHQTHSNLREYLVHQPQDSHQRMIVLTYCAFTEPLPETCILLHSVDTEKELYHALQTATQQKSQLVIQCDVQLSTRRRIIQAKFLIDSLLTGQTSRVFLVLHLPRRASSDSFLLDFSDRWGAVFVDVVHDSKDAVDLKALSSLALYDVLDNKELDLGKALHRCFRRSMLRVVYPCRRTNESIRHQIELLDSLIRQEPRFIKLFRRFSLRMVRERNGICTYANKVWDVLGCKRPPGSLLNGFQAAFDLIVEQLFGLLLAYVEENSCLALLCSKVYQDLWFLLAGHALLQTPSVGLRYEAAFCNDERFLIAAHNDNRPAFACKFPFSINIHHKISALRSSWSMLMKDDDIEGLTGLMPEFLKQLDIKRQDHLVDFVHDVYFMLFSRRFDRARHLQDCVLVEGPSLLLKLLEDLETPVKSLAHIYVAVWKHDRIIDAFFDVVRLVPLDDWHQRLSSSESMSDNMITACANIAIQNVTWDFQDTAARLAITRLLEVGDVVPPVVWSTIELAARVLHEAPHCSNALRVALQDHSGHCGDLLQFDLPLDAYIAVPCEPHRLLRRAAKAEASLSQCLSVLHALAHWNTPEAVGGYFQTLTNEDVSPIFTAACVLFLTKHSYLMHLGNVDDVQLDGLHNVWGRRIYQLARAHVAITTAAATLDLPLMQTCDKKFFSKCETARWLFWRSLALNHSVTGIEHIIQSGKLRSLQISAFHDVRLPLNAPVQPPFNPFGAIDGRVYTAASCGGSAMKDLEAAWEDSQEVVGLSVATYWWRLTTDIVRVPVSERHVLKIMRRDVLPLDEEGYLWGFNFVEPRIELIMVYAFAKTTLHGSNKSVLWSPLCRELQPISLLPGFPGDKRQEVIAAAGGTKIYECPNGHTYVIANCGMAAEMAKCATCGARIGGQNHQLIPGNREVNLPPQEEIRGYCIGKSEANDRSEISAGERGHSALEIATLRALVHTAALVHSDCSWIGDTIDNRNEVELEFGGDWRAFAVHQLTVCLDHVANVINVEKDEAAAMFVALIGELCARCSREAGVHSFATAEGRRAWEQEVSTVVNEFISAEKAAPTMAAYPVGAEGMQGLYELVDRLRRDAFPDDSSSFWRPIHSFEREMLVEQLQQESLERKCDPAVFELLQFVMENLEELHALQHVAGAVRWLTQCYVTFDLRVTHSIAREHSTRSMLQEKDLDRSSFNEFCALWAALFKKVEYECMHIPEALRTMHMDDSASLAFSLLSDEDEGLCARAILQLVQELNNRLLTLAHKVIHVKTEEDDLIPLRLVEPCQVAHLDADGTWAYAERACFDYCTSKASKCFDLSKLAVFVAERMRGKPLIRCQLPAIRFIGRDTHGSVALDAQLQQLLSGDAGLEFREMHRQSLESELHNAELASRDFQTLQTILQFIVDTQESGSDLSELQLEKFAVDILRMPKPIFVSMTLATVAKLKHGRWLLRAVAMLATDDPTAGVLPKYNTPLGTALKTVVMEWMEKLPTDTLRTVRDELAIICREYFTQGSLNSEEKLNVLLDMREELDGIHHSLPSSLLCRHTVPLIKLLDTSLQ